MKIFLLSILFLSYHVNATWINPDEIKPRSNIQSVSKANMTEEQFAGAIRKIQNVYQPIVKKLGGRLKISGDWKKTSLFAGTTQLFGVWAVEITGGLARNPHLTTDGMSLILCHELGHHLGGFAFGKAQTPIQSAWAANEGQSDYFATHVCAKKLWQSELEINAGFRATTSTVVKSQCDSVWNDSNQKDLCYRILAAVESVSNTMANLKGQKFPHFDTPDKSIVQATNNNHPDTQCRMDTSLQGALCLAQFDDGVIPGKRFSNRTENIESEREAARYTCTILSGFSVGLRPSCWFKARL